MMGNSGFYLAGFVVTVVVIPVLIIALTIMVPARALVALKRAVS